MFYKYPSKNLVISKIIDIYSQCENIRKNWFEKANKTYKK